MPEKPHHIVEDGVNDWNSSALTRREAIRRLVLLGVSVAGAPALLAACGDDGPAADSRWNAVLAQHSDVPTITVAAATQIDGGTTVIPTADYYQDAHFRYDGCHVVLADGNGVYASPPEIVVPELVTDAQKIETVFRSGRSGKAVIGVRAVIDGKLSHLKMLRFDAEKNRNYYFKHEFSSARVRHLKFEVDGATRFHSATVSEHTVLERPKGLHNFRHTVIGDSILHGGADFHIGTEKSGDFFYMCWETHGRFLAALMGCDSYVRLTAGGTGWTDIIPKDPFSNRIPLALDGSPHVLGFHGSRNDAGKENQVVLAVADALDRVKDVPVVIVSGPQQAGYSELNNFVKQGLADTRRTWIDLDGLAGSPSSNPTGHPTFEEQLSLALSAFDQLDMTSVREAVDRDNASRQVAAVVLSTSPVSPVPLGASVSLKATVTADQSVSGAVQFFDDVVPLGPPVAVVDGTATTVVGDLNVAAHSMRAQFLPARTRRAIKTDVSEPVTLVVSDNLGVVDSFNRPDGEVGLSENGRPWNTSTFPGWVIRGGALANPAAMSQVFCDIDPGVRFGTYEYTLAGSFHADFRLCLFYVDSANHVFLNCNGGANNWRLYARNGNESKPVATGTVGAGWVAGDVIRIEVTEGSSPTKSTFVAKKNGSDVLTANDVSLGTVVSGGTKIAVGVNGISKIAALEAVSMTPAG